MKTTFKEFVGEALITEGQFSWMTHDTGNQIGSEKQNTIEVTMFDNKGNKWTEKKYDGYGEFSGKDYYELLAQMNGIENAGRQDGIDLAFGKQRIKGKVLFPALIEDPRSFNYKKHDFTQEAPNDPNQSWYQEEEEDDYNESIVTESAVTKLADKLMDMDYTVFKSLGLRSGGELYSNKMMQKKYTDAMKAAIDKAGIADTITKNGQAIYDELEDNNYHSTNAFLVLGGYILPKLIGMYKEIAKSSPNSTLQPFNESLVTESKVTFHFKEFDNSLHFSDGTIVKIDYDGDFEYRSKWFTIESDVEKQLNKAFPTDKFQHAARLDESVATSTSSSDEYSSFFVKLLAVRDQAHIFHWQTKSFEEHDAFGGHYEAYIGLMDNLAEAIMGKYQRPSLVKGIIELEDYSPQAIETYLGDCYMLFVEDSKAIFSEQDSELNNIVDEIIALLDKLKYVLTLK